MAPLSSGVIVKPYFKGCTDIVIEHIHKAEHSVRIIMYYFTAIQIAQALIQAQQRGVALAVILDKSQKNARGSVARFLTQHGVNVLIDSDHKCQHQKLAVIDDRIVLTGSFNFTVSAEERNSENLWMIKDPAAAADCSEEWCRHAEHSRPYDR